jgi:hypothetical protein
MVRRRAATVIFALLPMLAGCTHFVIKPPCAEFERRPSDAAAQESKSCVFVFLIDPLDPFVGGDLSPMSGELHKLGFGKTFHGRSAHVSYFVEKMRSISGYCGSARFVVIGYRGGADAAQELADRATAEGLPVVRAILLEPNSAWVTDPDAAIPTFVMTSAELTEADAAQSPVSDHVVKRSEVPTHPRTLALIERELTLVALGIPPKSRPEAVKVVLVPPLPSPRDTPANPKPLPEEWQFLRPKSPWERHPPTLPELTEPLPLPKIVPVEPIPKAKP